jgi:hypothetical protein
VQLNLDQVQAYSKMPMTDWLTISKANVIEHLREIVKAIDVIIGHDLTNDLLKLQVILLFH